MSVQIIRYVLDCFTRESLEIMQEGCFQRLFRYMCTVFGCTQAIGQEFALFFRGSDCFRLFELANRSRETGMSFQIAGARKARAAAAVAAGCGFTNYIISATYNGRIYDLSPENTKPVRGSLRFTRFEISPSISRDHFRIG